MTDTTAVEAANFQRLPVHPNAARALPQHLALEIQTRFGAEFLADRLRGGYQAAAGSMDREHSRQRAFGMPLARWKEHQRRVAAPRHMQAIAAAQARHG